jgi:hypothetical protein
MTGDPALLVRQMELCRDFSASRSDARQFIREFLELHHQDNGLPAKGYLELDAWTGDIWFDIDLHNEYDEYRTPDEYDDDQLRAAVTERLRKWDEGTYPPPHT